jgi:hypothetical protein
VINLKNILNVIKNKFTLYKSCISEFVNFYFLIDFKSAREHKTLTLDMKKKKKEKIMLVYYIPCVIYVLCTVCYTVLQVMYDSLQLIL